MGGAKSKIYSNDISFEDSKYRFQHKLLSLATESCRETVPSIFLYIDKVIGKFVKQIEEEEED